MVDNLRGWLFGLIGIDTLCPLKDQFGFVKLVNQFGACIRFYKSVNFECLMKFVFLLIALLSNLQ